MFDSRLLFSSSAVEYCSVWILCMQTLHVHVETGDGQHVVTGGDA